MNWTSPLRFKGACPWISFVPTAHFCLASARDDALLALAALRYSSTLVFANDDAAQRGRVRSGGSLESQLSCLLWTTFWACAGGHSAGAHDARDGNSWNTVFPLPRRCGTCNFNCLIAALLLKLDYQRHTAFQSTRAASRQCCIWRSACFRSMPAAWRLADVSPV